MYGKLQQEYQILTQRNTELTRNETKQLSHAQLLNRTVTKVSQRNAELQTISCHTIHALERLDKVLTMRQT
eukprot:CAMPEP_0202721246 /NCGR_PEP_ID=MMETSP1385-20130828/147245_1 /ASSEMBLY_ACC=CAM_ASM_000861 /TAXON_ID=933848 /ORGANISM="Elphidium margaritaceum" /LENGTH=70 /DNA_ID=CAMNT_0049385387 /DNA_START=1 /DNA_END=209 /DNA_ORIENTATION=+